MCRLVFKQMPPIWISLTYVHLLFSAAHFDLSTRTPSNFCLTHHSNNAPATGQEQAAMGTCHLYEVRSLWRNKNHFFDMWHQQIRDLQGESSANRSSRGSLFKSTEHWFICLVLITKGKNDSKSGATKIPHLVIAAVCVVCVSPKRSPHYCMWKPQHLIKGR